MAEDDLRYHNGRFKPGHRKIAPHRVKGVGNRITKDIKEGMMESAIAHGADGKGKDGLPGFCRWLLANDLRAWCQIFGKMVPLQVNADVNYSSVNVNIMPIPSGYHFSAEEAKQLSKPGFEPAPFVVLENNDADEPAAV